MQGGSEEEEGDARSLTWWQRELWGRAEELITLEVPGGYKEVEGKLLG